MKIAVVWMKAGDTDGWGDRILFHEMDEGRGRIREYFFSSKYLMFFKFSLPFPVECFIIKVLNYANHYLEFAWRGEIDENP